MFKLYSAEAVARTLPSCDRKTVAWSLARPTPIEIVEKTRMSIIGAAGARPSDEKADIRWHLALIWVQAGGRHWALSIPRAGYRWPL